MARDKDGEREIVFVEREEASLKPILFGALLGLAVGLLFAPQSGDETRRQLKRRLRKARALAEEKVGEITERLGERRKAVMEDGDAEEERAELRTELERRLAEARSRRRAATTDDDEEPVA
jgi:gas vesicle protein